ncbi:HpcH/HpaI aldolase/citrate lyase family protein [Mesorhizobium kowhaii]|uniref:HpcH/HpaI aldolase/citrate lyase family protein n=1 Tax=Mesorhizobium kowhaii TaxID=1300272 RepID=UPI0035E53AB1
MIVSGKAWAVISSARALLFVPGDRPERFSKALASGADLVIIDLEDAVSSENKSSAREALRDLNPGASGNVIVRINSVASTHFQQDVETCAAARVAGLMLPKAESASDLDAVSVLSGEMAVVPLVESAKGMVNLGEIASHRSTARLAFGSIDYRIDFAISTDGVGLAAARSEIVLRSRFHNLPSPIEGVTPNFRDEQALEADMRMAREFGFGGKLAIHPLQVEPIQRGFRSTPDEIAWARKILDAVEAAGGAVGSISVAGEMIDRPVVQRAKNIIDRTH